MAETPLILRSQPGIKRDGTKFDGEFYTDGQWVRFQRGMPRKIGGYRSVQKYLTEVSRGFTAFTQKLYSYCHSGGQSELGRFTTDSAGNSSIITDRTPTETEATGTVSLLSGAGGSVTGVTVNGVQLMSGSEVFTTDLETTAANVADNINAFSTDYTAAASGSVITITANAGGATVNNYVVEATSTVITTDTTDMHGGAAALVSSSDNKWMFDYQYDSSTSDNYLLAHVGQNLSCACNDTNGQIFFGSVTGTEPLVGVELPSGTNCSGGIVSLHPYLVYYGTDGIIGWSKAGEPTNLIALEDGAGVARVWGQKIIKGLPLRAGSGSAPAGIFWAWDAVVRMIFTGGSTVFQFDVVATNTSILSSDCVIDYDGTFYWAGVDRFLMFNGVVREVPNQLNLNYFYDGLNRSQRSKVFAFSVPKYGEIWWCYPRGEETECSHAVIYNVRENTWYDTALPSSMRTAGCQVNAFAAPMLTDGGTKVWLHESGVDEIDGRSIQPISSWFETADLSSIVKGQNGEVRITRIEPDFVQSGPMNVQVTGRSNARAPEIYSSVFEFPETAGAPYEQIVMMKEQRRELRVRFESNAVGGDYQMGQIIGHMSSGDKTVIA